MKNLIIPAAGKSTRFPGMKPKWLLKHPDGDLMVAKSIKGINYNDAENIFLIVLEEHIRNFCNNSTDVIMKSFKELGIDKKLKIVILNEYTNSQPETVKTAIERENIRGSIFIKDVDSYFECFVSDKNAVYTFDLNKMDLVHAKNKSYVQIDDKNFITNIVEKKVISSKFCVGGYGFNSAQEFLKCYSTFDPKKEFYISHMIFKMLLNQLQFISVNVENYIDWGTAKEWNNFRNNYANVFIEIDGILRKKSETGIGNSLPIQKNIDKINWLYKTGNVKVILTTSKSKQEATLLKSQLDKLGIYYHSIIFDLFYAKKIIISDYNNTNPYKNCDAINIKTNSIELSDMLDHCMRCE